MRDSQKEKVYDAERKWGRTVANPTLDLVSSRETLKRLSAEFAVPEPVIRYNHKIRRFGGWYKSFPKPGLIEVPSGDVHENVILHEFSHHLDRHREEKGQRLFRAHGGSFTEAMVDVVWFSEGTGAAQALIADYRSLSVDIGRDEEDVKVAAAYRQQVAATKRMRRLDGEDGVVYLVKKKHGGDGDIYYAKPSYRYYYTTSYRPSARAYRSRSAADKAGEKVFRLGHEVEKCDGYFSLFDKAWVAY